MNLLEFALIPAALLSCIQENCSFVYYDFRLQTKNMEFFLIHCMLLFIKAEIKLYLVYDQYPLAKSKP